MNDKLEAFQDQIQTATKPILVDFWAYWCGYCRRLMPVMDLLETKWKEKLMFIKIDVEEYPTLVDRYHIDVIPCLLLLADGAVVDRLINPASMDEIETWLQNHLRLDDSAC